MGLGGGEETSRFFDPGCGVARTGRNVTASPNLFYSLAILLASGALLGGCDEEGPSAPPGSDDPTAGNDASESSFDPTGTPGPTTRDTRDDDDDDDTEGGAPTTDHGEGSSSGGPDGSEGDQDSASDDDDGRGDDTTGGQQDSTGSGDTSDEDASDDDGDIPGTTTCCPDGDCLCHGPDPTELTSSDGPFSVDSYDIALGKIFYPSDADPPFAAIAIVPGFTNRGPEMEPWGSFYASHGFVMIALDTGGTDSPDVRARKLLAGVEALKEENLDPDSPLFNTSSGRYGTSGYSMGGGGTTIASGDDPTLRTSVGLASWNPETAGVEVPTLLLCGASDGTAPCRMSEQAYDDLPDTTPKMLVSIDGTGHLSWFSPTSAGRGVSGAYALAFQKVYLAGDERWRSVLLSTVSNAEQTTNIQ